MSRQIQDPLAYFGLEILKKSEQRVSEKPVLTTIQAHWEDTVFEDFASGHCLGNVSEVGGLMIGVAVVGGILALWSYQVSQNERPKQTA